MAAPGEPVKIRPVADQLLAQRDRPIREIRRAAKSAVDAAWAARRYDSQRRHALAYLLARLLTDQARQATRAAATSHITRRSVKMTDDPFAPDRALLQARAAARNVEHAKAVAYWREELRPLAEKARRWLAHLEKAKTVLLPYATNLRGVADAFAADGRPQAAQILHGYAAEIAMPFVGGSAGGQLLVRATIEEVREGIARYENLSEHLTADVLADPTRLEQEVGATRRLMLRGDGALSHAAACRAQADQFLADNRGTDAAPAGMAPVTVREAPERPAMLAVETEIGLAPGA